ncbi:tRNA uridine-5-carboxymethylaminomethyl(34) synthesis GTPase MnmE [Rhizobium alvei]|uniref:tRNA modification GTPase MnmE n=1 Tax=Rhizobium alvei TaxID=1132659 RepID=A0ABT8YM27_9HYPH|nr:tRNA uridine-5-carboxymethylaminomethyl(34) synthesis GTPase MnmE [Rhizobium alvei]MDO6964728.1 tRNA uridine-5-carboxymethylaminomethyl(34) synthesis GTPase MnmE [Rhizobium alvei]
MASLTTDTIYALSSGQVPAGIAVVRVSGSMVALIAKAILGSLPAPRKAVLTNFRNSGGTIIDRGLALYFPSPDSFTGEDCLEFHCHGSRAVVNELQRALAENGNARQAYAGEFTQRAFRNGKIDLVEAEGLADLLSAETEMQRRLAMQQASGEASDTYKDWAFRLTRYRALLEAELDFADEADVPGSVSAQIFPQLEDLVQSIGSHIEASASGALIRDGYHIVIAGKPNAGKSSLLNALAKRDIAIVSEQAGTTRDVLSVDLDLDGFMVHISDTAGLRQTDDSIEKEGVRRAINSIDEADLVILLRDAREAQGYADIPILKPTIRVANKLDLPDTTVETGEIGLSVRTGMGFDSLTKRITESIQLSTTSVIRPTAVRQRQVDLLRKTKVAIGLALTEDRDSLEIIAEHLRQAGSFLGRLTGSVDTEDLLDVIFSEFCIGK